MNPRTVKTAIEKLYRVRQYLNGQMAYGHLDLDTAMAFRKAYDICMHAQRATGDAF